MSKDRPPTLGRPPEEEKVDSPAGPPRRFVHPSACFEWIRSSEGTGREASARQCPQCKTTYEVESNNPMVLRFLRAVDKNLGGVDLGFYLVGFGFVIRAVYRAQISYGAWALRKYIGDEMFELLLTNERSSWPLVAKLNIVMIPASLILARLGYAHPLSAILATWPAFAFTYPTPSSTSTSQFQLRRPDEPTIPAPWPPSPLIFGFVLLPICRRFYKYYFTRFSRWVLGIPDYLRPTLLQRLLDNMERAAEGARGDGNGNANANGNNAAEEPNREVISQSPAPMGRILHRLAQSTHFGLLPWPGFFPPPPLRRYSAREIWRRATGQLDAVRFVLGAVWGDVRKLDDCDPVWWRKFCWAKDFIQLFHLWLTQRELATRRVKNRDFSGVDLSELDLLPMAVN
ncbi:hypothetical protein C8F01DRAFT_1149087 [Mycena amicta]|nr:hypothetical protein C8F01DRAFT_1149087 [Mycena amicta]